jgi:PQQ-dependent catabolism-associated CXXCW motif protein
MPNVVNRSGALGIVLSFLTLVLAAERPDAAEPAPDLFTEDGYRIADFMAAVPQEVPGAIFVDTVEVRSLVGSGEVVLIDVLPAPPKPANLPRSALWLPPQRRNIPGSVWLPNVGYGRLSDALEDYFRRNLRRLSGGRADQKIVVYCLANCWMSWNAAKRAGAYGYSRVYWYADGTTGWESAGLPLTPSEPVPMD